MKELSKEQFERDCELIEATHSEEERQALFNTNKNTPLVACPYIYWCVRNKYLWYPKTPSMAWGDESDLIQEAYAREQKWNL
jgi:hypothetical protein